MEDEGDLTDLRLRQIGFGRLACVWLALIPLWIFLSQLTIQQLKEKENGLVWLLDKQHSSLKSEELGREERKQGHHSSWMHFKSSANSATEWSGVGIKSSRQAPLLSAFSSLTNPAEGALGMHCRVRKRPLCWQNIQGFSISLTKPGKSGRKRGKESNKGFIPK